MSMDDDLVRRRLEPTLLELASSFPVVTVTGPRQSGKTTLCRMAFPKLPYVSLENPDERRYALEDPRGLLAELTDGAVVDEVQRAPELLSYLQGMVDDDPRPGRFILTGSANLALRADVPQSLAGRTALLELLPLDLEERAVLAPTEDLWQVVWQGSYPAIHHRGVAADLWLRAYVATYLERDLRQHLAVGDLNAFQGFLELVAAHTGRIVNHTALGSAAGVSHNTSRSWLSVLEASYLVHLLPPLHRNLRKRVIKAPKMHLVDSGLACWLLGIRSSEELRHHPLRGAVFESWVAAEVRKALASGTVRARLHHWRDQRGRELDLVVDRGRDLVAVEVKSAATVHAFFFDAFGYFEELLREAVPAPENGVRGVVVYAGDRRQQRTAGLLLPWSEIQAFAWDGTHDD